VIVKTLLVALLIIAVTCGGIDSFTIHAQTTQDDVDDVIRVDSDLTNLLFTATDKKNRFVTTVKAEDIQLVEDGVRQTLVTFQRETDRPLSLAFLIDVSGSQERTLPEEKAAARSFIETVIQSNKDQAALVAFTGSAFLEQDLTRDVLGLYRALERIDVAVPTYLGAGRPISGIASGPGTKRPPISGTTALWEAIALTANKVLAPTLEIKNQNRQRRAIILLTDGWDTSSRLNMQEAISSALATETTIYSIGIGDSKHDGVDKYALENLSNATGGRAFFPKKELDLRSAFAEIEKELRSQYLIAYSSTNKRRDGSYRQMRLEIVNPQLRKEDLQLRYRPGYFAHPIRVAK
jgi:Ca-activated chloride channel family protein